jgi:hypothetical protein
VLNTLTPSPSPVRRGESAAFAQVIHNGTQQANPHGIKQEREGLSRASEKFGVERVKGVNFHPKRAARGVPEG